MEYVGNIIYDTYLKQDNTKLVIFGAGRSGRKVYDFLEQNNKAQNIKYFCDNNDKLCGKKIGNVEIVCPTQVIRSEVEYHFLVSGDYADEIVMFLMKNGIKKIHILFL
ncbi:MAG: hypothetical protein NC434_02050 [Ruminococcus sp.]|nr:hypothetical protein [Ruminococcus sp.]